jgi:hypothetical protein
MDLINKAKCSVLQANTGISECFLGLKNIIGAIFVPKDFKITSTDYATVQGLINFLQLKTYAEAKDRIYPLINFIDIEDGSEDDVKNTSGYGYEETVRDGKYIWSFRYADGGLCINRNLHRLFRNRKMKVLLIDSNYQLVGTLKGTDIYGFSTGNIDPKKLTIATGADPTMYMIEIQLSDPKELNENFAIIDIESNPKDLIKGLYNVQLSTSNALGTSVDVAGLIGCEKLNLFDSFEDELEDNGAWIIKNSTGVAVTVTGVSKNTSAKTWTVSATMPAGNYTIQLAEPLTLLALGVGVPPANGYESDVVSFTVGS